MTTIAQPYQEVVLWNTAFHRWFEWCCGAWVGNRIYRRVELKISPGVFLLVLLGWLAIGFDVKSSGIQDVGIKVLYEPLVGLFVGSLIWALLTLKVSIIPRIGLLLQQLGLISYSVYLLHQIFVSYLQSALLPNNWSIATNVGLLFTLVLLVALPISILYHHFFEHLPLKSTARSS